MINITKPIITEKSMNDAKLGKYTFKVHEKTNKKEVAKEVESSFKVTVTKVNIMNVKAKKRTYRFRKAGFTKDWKKAIVTLKKGDKIKDFEIKEEKSAKRGSADSGPVKNKEVKSESKKV